MHMWRELSGKMATAVASRATIGNPHDQTTIYVPMPVSNRWHRERAGSLKSPWETVRKLTQLKSRETSLVLRLDGHIGRPSPLPVAVAVAGDRSSHGSITLPPAGGPWFPSHRPGSITVQPQHSHPVTLHRGLDESPYWRGATCADWATGPGQASDRLRLRHVSITLIRLKFRTKGCRQCSYNTVWSTCIACILRKHPFRRYRVVVKAVTWWGRDRKT